MKSLARYLAVPFALLASATTPAEASGITDKLSLVQTTGPTRDERAGPSMSQCGA